MAFGWRITEHLCTVGVGEETPRECGARPVLDALCAPPTVTAHSGPDNAFAVTLAPQAPGRSSPMARKRLPKVSQDENPQQPQVGGRVQVLPERFMSCEVTGAEVFADGDYGVIEMIDTSDLHIRWPRTARTSRIGRVAWATWIRLLAGEDVPGLSNIDLQTALMPSLTASQLAEALAKFEGKWEPLNSRSRSNRCVRTISGAKLRLADGTTSVLRPVSDSIFETEIRGVACRAELGLGGRALFWSDGDRWVRATEASPRTAEPKRWSGHLGTRSKRECQNEADAFDDDGELRGPLSGLNASGGPIGGLKLELAAQALLGRRAV